MNKNFSGKRQLLSALWTGFGENIHNASQRKKLDVLTIYNPNDRLVFSLPIIHLSMYLSTICLPSNYLSVTYHLSLSFSLWKTLSELFIFDLYHTNEISNINNSWVIIFLLHFWTTVSCFTLAFTTPCHIIVVTKLGWR